MDSTPAPVVVERALAAPAQAMSLTDRIEQRPVRTVGALLALVATTYLVVAPFPSSYYAIRPGLDCSWVWAINWVADSQFRFGRDVAFTYGPLGYLLYPANIGHHVLASIVFRWTIAGCTALAMLA